MSSCHKYVDENINPGLTMYRQGNFNVAKLNFVSGGNREVYVYN